MSEWVCGGHELGGRRGEGDGEESLPKRHISVHSRNYHSVRTGILTHAGSLLGPLKELKFLCYLFFFFCMFFFIKISESAVPSYSFLYLFFSILKGIASWEQGVRHHRASRFLTRINCSHLLENSWSLNWVKSFLTFKKWAHKNSCFATYMIASNVGVKIGKDRFSYKVLILCLFK